MAIGTVDCTAVAAEWLARLNSVATGSDVNAFSDLFLSTGWMRDLLCFSWDFRSLGGRDKISTYLSEDISESGDSSNHSRLAHAGLSDIVLETSSSLGPPSSFSVPDESLRASGVIAAFTFTLKNPARTGHGLVRLVQDHSDDDMNGLSVWKAFTLLFNAEDLVGHEELKGRPMGPVCDPHSKSWSEIRAEWIKGVESDPTVLIIGGGQAGLMCAARMGRMGIRALVVDKVYRVGDNWRNRYPNLSLHTPAYQSTMLYHPWPITYPKFLPRDIVADFLEAYAIGQNVAIWLSSTVLNDPNPVFDEKTGTWTVLVHRQYPTSDGVKSQIVTLHPRHIVMATGTGYAHIPQLKGMGDFKGSIYHSDQHKDAEIWAGKKAVVVGAGNAAADVAQSFLSPSHRADSVTMIQRSATCVVSIRAAETLLFSSFASEAHAIEDADLLDHSIPCHLGLQLAARGGTEHLKKMDEELLEGLRKRGFNLTWELEPGAGEVGLFGFFVQKASSGTMIDFKCGQSIIDGDIQIKSGVEIDRLEPHELVLSDGSRLPADVVVLATGNLPIITNATSLFGPRITDKIGNKIWGLDAEGELNNCFRPTGQRGLWIVTGGFQQSRFLSKHLAMQILAEELGLKTTRS